MRPTQLPVAPPIAFAATNCQLVGKHPNGVQEYWTADIKAARYDTFVRIFADVLFIETPCELVYLMGVESPGGVDRLRLSDSTIQQAVFIQFLLEENDRDAAVLGSLSSMFVGSEYATIGKATAAYLAARSLTHAFGVGFMNADGKYQLIKIEPGEESGFDGNRYLPFDELGV